MIKLYNDDCFNVLKDLKDDSIDLILCDPPYATTALKWDNILPFDKLWEEYKRLIRKDGGAIVLFSAQPFTTQLIYSNLEMYRYSWIWEKEGPTGFLNAAYAPLKLTEDINVFSFGTVGSNSKNKIRYFPQGLIEVNKLKRNNPNSNWRKNKGYNSSNNVLNSDKEFTQKYTNYPTNILRFNREQNAEHPTQKPVELLKYLINTYSLEGETVLDNCMGSGSTMVACKETNRNGIGIELNKEYFDIAKGRINL